MNHRGPPDVQAQITFLTASDLTETSRFYEQVIGLRLAVDQGVCRIYEVTEGAYVGFCERNEPVLADGIILTLVSHDVDGFAEILRARGMKIEKEPQHNSRYGIYHCIVRDPNGYKLEIQRFDDRQWNQPSKKSGDR